jgi:hypothetical protein
MFAEPVRRAGVTLLIALAPLCTGCGALFQTIAGWHSEEQVRHTERAQVQVTSVPPGAEISRRDAANPSALVQLGNAPLTDSIEIGIEETRETPKTTWLWIGAGLELLSVASSIIALNGSGDIGATVGGLSAATFMGLFAITDAIIALVHGSGDPNVTGRKVISGGGTAVYSAHLSGYPDATKEVQLPDTHLATLVLGGSGGDTLVQKSGFASPPPAGAPLGPAPSWVVAVMEVEDVNARRPGQAIDPDLLRNLTDQLRVLIGQQRIRTIDRGVQEQALREQVTAAKKDSYKQCVDASCQVELGKALAASHILRSSVTRFGQRCSLNAELIDLKSEVSIAAGSARGDCRPEGFLNMSEEVARRLTTR